MTANEKTKPRTQLDRNDWIHAALDVLGSQGLSGLRVEVLAKTFGITKGSFYWHFKDRQDLLSAVLETWKEGRIRDIIKQTTSEPGKEREQLYKVIDTYSATRNRKGISIELAVRDWARRDAQANAIVEEVDTTRLECTRRLFVGLGLPEHEARSRSVMLYAYVFGQSLMACNQFDQNLASLKGWIADRIVQPAS